MDCCSCVTNSPAVICICRGQRAEPISRVRGARFGVEWIVAASATSHVSLGQSRYRTDVSCPNPRSNPIDGTPGGCVTRSAFAEVRRGVARLAVAHIFRDHSKHALRALLLSVSCVAADHRQATPAQGSRMPLARSLNGPARTALDAAHQNMPARNAVGGHEILPSGGQ